jgi:hypothetical protein
MGEAIVAYELMKRDWDVMRHLCGQGYDLWATKGRVSRTIEVKTTDPERRTGPTKRQLTVLLSEAEQHSADFLVYYIHGFGDYFIIPKSAFPETRSGSVTVIIGKKSGKIGPRSKYEEYRNKWEALD